MSRHSVTYRIENKVNPYVRYYEATLDAHSKNELKAMMKYVYNFHTDNEKNVFFVDYSVTETFYDLIEVGLLADLDGKKVPVNC